MQIKLIMASTAVFTFHNAAPGGLFGTDDLNLPEIRGQVSVTPELSTEPAEQGKPIRFLVEWECTIIPIIFIPMAMSLVTKDMTESCPSRRMRWELVIRRFIAAPIAFTVRHIFYCDCLC